MAAQSGALLLRDPRPEDADQLVALRNNPVVNRFMLRTHLNPDAYAQEWSTIPDSDTDFSCIAELDGQPADLGFLDVIDGLGQPGMPLATQGVIGYMLQPDLTDADSEQTWHAAS